MIFSLRLSCCELRIDKGPTVLNNFLTKSKLNQTEKRHVLARKTRPHFSLDQPPTHPHISDTPAPTPQFDLDNGTHARDCTCPGSCSGVSGPPARPSPPSSDDPQVNTRPLCVNAAFEIPPHATVTTLTTGERAQEFQNYQSHRGATRRDRGQQMRRETIGAWLLRSELRRYFEES